jgi:hypothetical protein
MRLPLLCPIAPGRAVSQPLSAVLEMRSILALSIEPMQIAFTRMFDLT